MENREHVESSGKDRADYFRCSYWSQACMFSSRPQPGRDQDHFVALSQHALEFVTARRLSSAPGRIARRRYLEPVLLRETGMRQLSPPEWIDQRASIEEQKRSAGLAIEMLDPRRIRGSAS